MTVLLTSELLDELGARLRSHGVSAIDAALPGLSPKAMQKLVSPLGISLPIEALVWWGWHNGVPRQCGAGATEIGPGRKWLPLEEAVSECLRIRELIAGTVGGDDSLRERAWSSTWLPLIHADGEVVIETDVPDDAGCPVRIYWFDEPEAPADLPSLGELVRLWIEAIDRGVWTHDPNACHWSVDHAALRAWSPSKRGIV